MQQSVYPYKGGNQAVSVGQKSKDSGEGFHTADAIKGTGTQNRYQGNFKGQPVGEGIALGEPNSPRNSKPNTLSSYYKDKYVQSGQE